MATNIDKSPNDLKAYREITLGNGLTATLISDGGAKGEEVSVQSAAGMCVGIGSFNDPDNLPGLAHYLEHVLFMGSATYPEENDFDIFIKGHGGASNAHTHLETTVFYFDVLNEHFLEALKRFSQFFISPLLRQGSMDRELNLVHAEWAMTVHHEKFRFEQLLSTTAKSGHPMGRFSWGNVETLKTIPESNEVDVNAAMKAFHKKYYRAKVMNLAIISKESLDELQSLVMDLFSAVPDGSPCIPIFDKAPFETPAFRRWYRIIPAKKTQQLQLTWALPSQLEHYRTKPLTYLANLIGHEGKGSLLLLLRKKGWAQTIRSGNAETSQEHNSTWAEFNVQLALTDAGLTNIFEVIKLVFQYINLLCHSGPQKRLWIEMQDIDQNEFDWLEPQSSQELVHQLSMDMHKYSTEDYITGGRLLRKYDANLITYCLSKLLPDEMNLSVWSKSFEGGLAPREPLMEGFYHTYYFVDDIPKEWLDQWRNCGQCSELGLPEANIFIAQNFELKDSSDCDIINLERPAFESACSRLWYKPDKDFRQPKAYIFVYVRSVLAESEGTNVAMMDLYYGVLRHLVSTVAYPAEVAHLKYTFCLVERGLVIQLHGFNDKLPDLFRTIVDCMKQFELTNEIFDMVSRQLSDLFHNMSLNPEKLIVELKRSIQRTKYSSIVKKLEYLKQVDILQLVDFAKKMYDGAYVETLIQGNVSLEEAVDLQKYVIESLCIKAPADPLHFAKTYLTKVPLGTSTYSIANKNDRDENSVITNYYQSVVSDLRSQLLNEMLVMNMEEPCFNQLRTKMQVGYEITLDYRSLSGIVGFAITVCSQATRFTMETIDEIVEKFLQDYNLNCIQNMKQEKFDNFVKSVMKLKNYEDANLGEAVNRNWREIVCQTFMFERHDVEIAELKTLTLKDLKIWSQNLLKPNSTRRKISVQVVGHCREQPKPKKKKKASRQSKKTGQILELPKQQIKDIDAFKATCERFEVVRKKWSD